VAQEAYIPRWSTVKVPGELRAKIRALAEDEGKAEWRIILDALSFYEAQKRRPRLKEELPVWEKVSWYVVKLAMSVGELKAKPTPENLELLRRTCLQIEERLGVNTGLLVRTAEAYLKDPSVDNRMELNASVKMVVFEIIYTHLFKTLE